MGRRAGVLVLAAATAAGIVVCLLLALPFLGPLTFALTLAILFAPLQDRVEAKLTQHGVAAAISVLLVVLIVAVPLGFVAGQLVAEAAAGAALVQERVAAGAIRDLLDSHPSIQPVAAWIERQVDLPAIMTTLTGWLSNFGAAFAMGSAARVLEIVLTFYLLFFFLRDRADMLRVLRTWLPLGAAEADGLFRRVSDTIHAIVYGTLAVAALQGMLGGLAFWVLGLPAPLLWGLVMGLLSIVPVLGSFVVWAPAAAVLTLQGDWVRALVLAAWGGIVVGNADNILRPILVGARLRLHTVPAFIAMLGGIIVLGLPGFILGPLAVTTTIALVEIWRGRSAQDGGPA